tara:strand:+ start:1179 stop:1451 length:273 start_codon:yes stop_codon:yes gene_type:complete
MNDYEVNEMLKNLDQNHQELLKDKEKKKEKIQNLLNCVVDLENYFIDFLDHLIYYQHSQGESEDDVKSNIANILENNNCYDLVREKDKGD